MSVTDENYNAISIETTLYNVYESDRLYLSYVTSDSITIESELLTKRGTNNTATYKLFNFVTSRGYELMLRLYLGINKSETIYNVLVSGKNENDEIIYEGDILPRVTLIASTVSSDLMVTLQEQYILLVMLIVK